MEQKTKHTVKGWRTMVSGLALGSVMGGVFLSAVYGLDKMVHSGSQRVISALDTNHDGVLSAEEKKPFVQWLLASGGVSSHFYGLDTGQTTLPESIRSELEKTLIDKEFDFQWNVGVDVDRYKNTARIRMKLGEEYIEQHSLYKTSK